MFRAVSRLYREHPQMLTAFALTFVVLCSPLLRNDMPDGYDLPYHLSRIEALYQQLLHGVWFSPINYYFLQGSGYAGTLGYPDVFIYIPALLKMFGAKTAFAYNAFLIICGIACFFTSWLAALHITKDKTAAALVALLYSLCQFHIDNFYSRGALGEIQAFVFIPLLIYGLYDLLHDGFKRPHIMAIGFIGLLFTHVISVATIALVYVVICLFHARTLLASPRLLWRLALTAGCVALATVFFWAPLLELYSSQALRVHHPWTVPSRSVIPINFLFRPIDLRIDKAGLGLPLVLFCLARLRLLGSSNASPERARADFFLWPGLVLTLMTTWLFPWKLFDQIFVFIQFPWRLFSIASYFLAVAGVGYLLLWIRRGTPNQYWLALVMGFIAAYGLVQYNLSVDFKKIQPSTMSFGGEFLPMAVTAPEKLGADKPIISAQGERPDISFTVREGEMRLVLPENVNNTAPETRTAWIDVPYTWYKGYSASLEAGGKIQDLPVEFGGENGRCRVILPEGAHGKVRVWYAGTRIQNAAQWISSAFWAGLLVWWIRKNKRKRVAS